MLYDDWLKQTRTVNVWRAGGKPALDDIMVGTFRLGAVVTRVDDSYPDAIVVTYRFPEDGAPLDAMDALS